MGSKILPQQVEQIGLIGGITKVVDRFVESPAKQQPPDPVGDRPFEAAIGGVSDPGGELRPTGRPGGDPFGMKRDPRFDHALRVGLAIEYLELAGLAVEHRFVFQTHN